ncbi:ATP-grasp domain-containing protein [Sinorhizobium meliloti]|uniref:ATP-grasp domain-containing protein n=1 Tax=Rhizobium meliloti TaxID=382 RepID=UPI0013E3D263|nr:ATP-grasp domain-containing protein [Sinorhizobium meliloti]MDW9639701.1 ATP-grasp domain-containing protein [Sinorhizobium meliloti]
MLSFSEVDVSRAARIRKHLGLAGQTIEDGELFRNKMLMKRRAWERGVAVPRFAQVTCPADLLDFISANGLPVVVKPYDGRGSAGVEILESEKDIRTFLARGSSTSKGFTVEEFVPGDMYRVDGLYVHGSPVIIHAGRYLKDCLAFIQGETIGTHGLDQGSPLNRRIETFTRHLLERALPFPKTSIFHLQIFLTPDDRLVLCEVASRLGGGVINEEVRLATGIDIKMSYVKACVGAYEEVGVNNLPPVPAGRIIIPPRRGTLRRAPAGARENA